MLKKKVLSVFLIFVILSNLFSCKTKNLSSSNSNDDRNIENPFEYLEVEEIRVDSIPADFKESSNVNVEYRLADDIYAKEILVVENKITELLLEENTVEEVLMCQTIYISQESIAEFSENSQISKLFGNKINLSLVFSKIAVGSGLIITLVILKKVGAPDLIASIVAGALDKSVKFSVVGGGIGSLFGGLTGGANTIDKSGRTSALIGLAAATAGLIVTTLSLAAALPSGGITTITAGTGVKLFFAGVAVTTAAAGTLKSGMNAINVFSSTDAEDINWSNVDWGKVGLSSAEKAIQNASDGFMWGSIIGSVYGGVDGFDFYKKFGTPYSDYNKRLVQTPSVNNDYGKWEGKRGESDFILNEPLDLGDGNKVYKITYKNAVPDFSTYAKAQIDIPNMNDSRYNNFKQADEILAEYWTKIKYNGCEWVPRDVLNYRESNGLTWHEMNNMKSMQLVPGAINERFSHFGGVAEYEVYVEKMGGNVTNEFD